LLAWVSTPFAFQRHSRSDRPVCRRYRQMALLPERKITACGYRDGHNKERKG